MFLSFLQGKVVQPADFDKERKYFQEVDAFELLEESPSPKHASTWTRGQNEDVLMPHLCSRLEKILISLKLNRGCGPSSSLFKLLKTPNMTLQPIRTFDFSGLRTPEEFALLSTPGLNSTQSRFEKILVEGDVYEKDGNSQKRCTTSVRVKDEDCEVIENAVKKLSLASTSASSSLHHVDPFDTLLAVCGLSTPSKLLDVLSNYWFVSYSQYAFCILLPDKKSYIFYVKCFKNAFSPFFVLSQFVSLGMITFSKSHLFFMFWVVEFLFYFFFLHKVDLIVLPASLS